jgi:hypothetical protein
MLITLPETSQLTKEDDVLNAMKWAAEEIDAEF